ncbi:MAG: hypothetical protein FJX74_06605 [Armatimonadetes bacterium]|nr:hypothetical protein [Armatimonadota bacterium]
MAATVRRVTAFRVTLGDRVGALADVLAAARNAGIDLQSVAGYVCGAEGVILAVPRDLNRARPASVGAPWALGEQDVFLMEGDDERGALVSVTEKLAVAGIGIQAAYAVAVEDHFAAVIAVDPADVDRAAAALGV